MNEKVLKCLVDIKMACEEMNGYFLQRPMTFEAYSQDILLKRGIERNLEMIGEAMSRILKEDSMFPLPDARRIVGLRNQITHGYDSVSDEIIWGIFNSHIPKLKEAIDRLIDLETK